MESSRLPTSTQPKYYAVKYGHVPGIYTDWPTASKQITGFSKAKHKSFTTRTEAEAYLRLEDPQPSTSIVFPNAITSISSAPIDAQPPAKKSKRSEQLADFIAQETATGYPLGYQNVPDAEFADGFDLTLLVDDQTNQLRRKTAGELDSTKAVIRTDFMSGNEEWINVWTDGACKANGNKGAVAGVGVWFGPDDPRYVSSFLQSIY
jgi:ribonuclease HI